MFSSDQSKLALNKKPSNYKI